jgi:hypothetical protein
MRQTVGKQLNIGTTESPCLCDRGDSDQLTTKQGETNARKSIQS